MALFKRSRWHFAAVQTGKHFNKGEYHKALEAAEETLAKSEKFYGSEHIYTNKSLYNLVRVHQKLENYELAERYGLRAINIIEEIRGEADSTIIDDLENIACLYKEWGKKDESKLKKFNEIEERINKIKQANNSEDGSDTSDSLEEDTSSTEQ